MARDSLFTSIAMYSWRSAQRSETLWHYKDDINPLRDRLQHMTPSRKTVFQMINTSLEDYANEIHMGFCCFRFFVAKQVIKLCRKEAFSS